MERYDASEEESRPWMNLSSCEGCHKPWYLCRCEEEDDAVAMGKMFKACATCNQGIVTATAEGYHASCPACLLNAVAFPACKLCTRQLGKVHRKTCEFRPSIWVIAEHTWAHEIVGNLQRPKYDCEECNDCGRVWHDRDSYDCRCDI